MKAQVAAQLLALNRQFYTDFGEHFSATRQRIQPGVAGILSRLSGDENILDLGCGNGEFARMLAKNGHTGSYTGLDFSLPLLADASAIPEHFSAHFIAADLTSDWSAAVTEALQEQGNAVHFSLLTSFATLHHIPSELLRTELLQRMRACMADDGKLILSNWQFLNSARLKSRIQPWEKIGLQAADVDEGDYLLDWRSGGIGLRYAHHFSETSLFTLAQKTGFTVIESFYSDGAEGNLGLYQVWGKTSQSSSATC